jgi:hypothetical protein
VHKINIQNPFKYGVNTDCIACLTYITRMTSAIDNVQSRMIEYQSSSDSRALKHVEKQVLKRMSIKNNNALQKLLEAREAIAQADE